MKSNIFQYGVISIIKFNATRLLEFIEHRYIAIYLIHASWRKRLRPGRCTLGRCRMHMFAERERRRSEIRAFDLAAGFYLSVARDVSRARNVPVHGQLARNLDILGVQSHFARLDCHVSFAINVYDRSRVFLNLIGALYSRGQTSEG